MMNANKKTPKLRFKGFTDDWEQCKLSDITEIVMGQSPSSKNYTDNPNDNILVQGNADLKDGKVIPRLWTKEITKTIDKDGIILTVRAPVGDVAKTDYKVVLGRGVAGIKGNDYIYQFLQKLQNNRYWVSLSSGSTFESINSNDIKDLIIDIPSIEEQTKISMLLNNVNSIITLHQRKIEKLKLNKSALLQKMFPQNRCAVPEVRFKGFAEDWEQRKLSDVLVERNEQEVETREYPLMSFVQGLGVVPKGERYDRSFLVLDQSKKYKRTELGDFIYSSNNLETGSIGINKTGKAVISPVYSIFQGVSIGDSQFIGIMSLLPKFIAKMIRFRQGVVYGQWRIHETDFLDISVLIPSVDERTKITQLILSIEEIIILHQRKLDRLMSIKKALLQQLFV